MAQGQRGTRKSGAQVEAREAGWRSRLWLVALAGAMALAGAGGSVLVCLAHWPRPGRIRAGASAVKPGDGVSGPLGMVHVPGGEFLMGSDHKLAQPNERPAHKVRVQGFWMDQHHVTNAEFRKFVTATGYVTTAERARLGHHEGPAPARHAAPAR